MRYLSRFVVAAVLASGCGDFCQRFKDNWATFSPEVLRENIGTFLGAADWRSVVAVCQNDPTAQVTASHPQTAAWAASTHDIIGFFWDLREDPLIYKYLSTSALTNEAKC